MAKKDIISNETPSNNSAVPFAVVEAFKTVRTSLLFMLSQNDKKIITVSSALPGEGKSTTSINTAVALSQLEGKVLLIDADLRKASIHKKLKLKNSIGLTSILAGFSTFEETVIEINPNLSVITSGPIPPNAAELLGSKSMDALLDKVGGEYDYVVIDTPPINIVSDALVVATKTSGLVMVVRDGYVTHSDFRRVLNSIELAKVKLLGAVINGTNRSTRKSYRYRYSYRYSYKYSNYSN